jgi:sugar/nucleoside kinase (ribokinase family)
VRDTTGAGDAFDAGFVVTWLAAAARIDAGVLRRAAAAAHRTARRELTGRRPELPVL